MTDQENATVREWTDLLRRIRFGATVTVPGTTRGVRGATLRAVALMLATYADADGSRIFPGTARIAVACEIDYRTAKRCLAALRWLGLIKVVRSARRRQLADEYRLTIPADLLEKVEVLSPAQMELAVERVRDGNRRRTTEPVRVRQAPVQPDPSDVSTGAGRTPTDGSTGASRTVLRVRQCPPTHHDVVTTTTHHTEVNLRTAVTGPRAREAEDQISEDEKTRPVGERLPDRCRHGLRSRIRDDGLPTCALCRRERAGPTTLAAVVPLHRRTA